ncbi:IS701 family transposase [Peterkaempfera bronchialis]|uniref:IS701 family transposase n=1 Tax=Peterkaempfera bronchialis TaxID=2126346 RepID=UPI003C2ADFEA
MFDQAMGRVAGRFARVEPRRRARALVLGLLSDLPRKNCWTLAAHAGDATPDGMQHLLHRAKCDAVRDDIRAYVTEHLRDPEAVLVVDETGDLKKGTATVGVQRQYTGTADRIENSQVAVYLVYPASRGHAAIDRALYVPRSWTEDHARCRAAGIPDDLAFAAKPVLAARMISRALDAGTPARWVAGDEVYGDNPHLRAAPEDRRRLRAGRLQHPPGDHARRPHPGEGPGHAHTQTRPAAAVRRNGCQRRAPLRLGAGRHPRPHRTPRPLVAAGPPQPTKWRTRLLPLLLVPPGTAVGAGARGRATLDGGGDLPGREGPGRPG